MPRRKTVKRVSRGRRNSMKRKSMRRNTMRRNTMRRKSMRRKSMRRKSMRRNTKRVNRRKRSSIRMGGANGEYVRPLTVKVSEHEIRPNLYKAEILPKDEQVRTLEPMAEDQQYYFHPRTGKVVTPTPPGSGRSSKSGRSEDPITPVSSPWRRRQDATASLSVTPKTSLLAPRSSLLAPRSSGRQLFGEDDREDFSENEDDKKKRIIDERRLHAMMRHANSSK